MCLGFTTASLKFTFLRLFLDQGIMHACVHTCMDTRMHKYIKLKNQKNSPDTTKIVLGNFNAIKNMYVPHFMWDLNIRDITSQPLLTAQLFHTTMRISHLANCEVGYQTQIGQILLLATPGYYIFLCQNLSFERSSFLDCKINIK